MKRAIILGIIIVVILCSSACSKKSSNEINQTASEYYSEFYSNYYKNLYTDQIIQMQNERIETFPESSSFETTVPQTGNQTQFDIAGLGKNYTYTYFGKDESVIYIRDARQQGSNRIEFTAEVKKGNSDFLVGIKYLDENNVVLENGLVSFPTENTKSGDVVKSSVEYFPSDTKKIELYNKG